MAVVQAGTQVRQDVIVMLSSQLQKPPRWETAGPAEFTMLPKSVFPGSPLEKKRVTILRGIRETEKDSFKS